MREHGQGRRLRCATSIARLTMAVEALQRDVVDVDDRDAVEILEPGAQRDDLQQIGDDLDVDHLAAGAFEELEHPHVLFGRQRDVQMVDAPRAR